MKQAAKDEEKKRKALEREVKKVKGQQKRKDKKSSLASHLTIMVPRSKS